MDLGHWNLRLNPFTEANAAYVATPAHAEAVARIVHAVESGDRRASLVAPAGLGKSLVLREALEHLRDPRRRIARSHAALDGTSMVADLARSLGIAVPASSGRAAAWKGLLDAARLCRIQGQSVVLAVDDAHRLREPADREDLDRLDALDCHPARRLTVIRVGREIDEPDAEPIPDPWALMIRLAPLSRIETTGYLQARLATAGRSDLTFTPKAVTSLHSLARGVPRGLDRLASLALAVGASRRLEIIGPDVIEGMAGECHRELSWC